MLFVTKENLPVPEELGLFMKKHSFHTMDELLKYSSGELLKMEGFGYRLLMILYNYLVASKCEHLLRE